MHLISRRRRLDAADLAGQNAEVLWESEGEEASAAAEEEVFGLETTVVEWERIGISKDGINIVVFAIT
ncbi:uncharacterized protein G2W53_014989 [Senna tora]|uniref:Uncharacterized protein n=1 Tax=Senna tora TaxID=362788 RepID=A0A834WUG9_9FABA|nr:uncharacterized protein G2W53_014989 [Senna tora]